MSTSAIVKLVKTFGSTWGRIKSDSSDREVFFNESSLEDSEAFASLEVGQTFTFEEHADQVTGFHATHMAGLVSRAAAAEAS